jgi:hypothetical protein
MKRDILWAVLLVALATFHFWATRIVFIPAGPLVAIGDRWTGCVRYTSEARTKVARLREPDEC